MNERTDESRIASKAAVAEVPAQMRIGIGGRKH